MEGAGNSSIELSGEKEAVMKTGQDGDDGEVAEEPEEVPGTSEVKQLSLINCEDDFTCEERTGAFERFPEEVWSPILDGVVDFEDIQNVLLAYPELENTIRSSRTSWMFGLVLPNLMGKYFVEETKHPTFETTYCPELMKLRLVSKHWKNAVDKALQNYPDRRPLLSLEKTQTGSSLITIPEHHLNYYRIRECSLAPNRFRTARDIDRFLEEMGDHQGNPFPSKSVHIQKLPNDHTGFRQLVARTLALLEKFGEYVFDLEFEYYAPATYSPSPVNTADLELCGNILRCLTLAPNLRSLVFTGQLFAFTNSETDNFYRAPESQKMFPKLRNLERFEWRVELDTESTWVTRLVETYAKKEGLRKLGIPLSFFWYTDLASHPNYHLTELHIFLDRDHAKWERKVERIEHLVESLSNHQKIRKFWLSASAKTGEVLINDIVRMVSKFQFESVVLQNLWLVETNVQPLSEKWIFSRNTVTSLDLEWSRSLSFKFLKEFRSLKYLTVFVSGEAMEHILREYRYRMGYWDYMGSTLKEGEMVNKMKRYFMNVNDPTLKIPRDWGGIWEDFPSLEVLIVVVQKSRGEMGRYCNVGAKFLRESTDRPVVLKRGLKAVKVKAPEAEDDEEEFDGDEDEEYREEITEGLGMWEEHVERFDIEWEEEDSDDYCIGGRSESD